MEDMYNTISTGKISQQAAAFGNMQPRIWAASPRLKLAAVFASKKHMLIHA